MQKVFIYLFIYLIAQLHDVWVLSLIFYSV